MAESITTVKCRQKLCKAHAGLATLPKIVKMAFGDGGLSEDGTPKVPTGQETDLYNKLLEKDIDEIELIGNDQTTVRYSTILEKAELAGKTISEIGLYDEDGDLCTIRTFLGKGKDEDIQMTYSMDEIF